jgi:hypothetical protein
MHAVDDESLMHQRFIKKFKWGPAADRLNQPIPDRHA